ncbi:hypothetical protein [Actinomadura madurae]|uniref:hypothetical protein n=1 Tax=Actinomadura madurae TaxID=1993 RepID=UPI0020D2178E|nr:hypothetical protein [Actinomadura madurae]MCQ0004078.1 hypothetical protein [Actinomadura madurae]
MTLDLAHRIAPGWRLCQFTTADRDAHRWHLRHDGHAAGAVTHVLDLRGRRTGWEARDARGFRLRPGPGPEAYRPGRTPPVGDADGRRPGRGTRPPLPVRPPRRRTFRRGHRGRAAWEPGPSTGGAR